ncbi:cholinesterase-like [Brevipalpus obovatus]|uniref:cholinesterase-like n=1 Tax=Brevipalpus obovatus TaxID=246614 RepID=UPI003D9E6628
MFAIIFLPSLLLLTGADRNPSTRNSESQPIVKTKYGLIKGTREIIEGSTVNSFRGIPYAIPPLHDLRFQPPQPVKPWGNDTLHATKYSPQCSQKSRSELWNDTDISFEPLTTSEDCLYMNVWTPSCNDNDKENKCNDKKYPVFVFIHGGSFISLTASASKLFEGKILSSLGQVVVVTFNYRLGSLGFMYADHPDSPGNQGLRDQQLALFWVKDNIASFSGDPTMVTVAGESAGGISASIHYLNQCRHGGTHENWVKRWIFSSGITIPGFWESQELALKRYKLLAAQVGCGGGGGGGSSSDPKTIISCLRSVPVNSLMDAQDTVAAIMRPLTTVPIQTLPTVGIEPYKESIFKVLASSVTKSFYPSQVLITNMQAEGIVFVPLLVETLIQPKLSWHIEVVRNNSRFFDVGSESALEEMISAHYSNDIEDNAYWLEYELIQMLGDRYFNCPSLYLAEALTDRGVESYQGLFNYCNNASSASGPNYFYGCKFGAQHGGDVAHVFGIPMLSGAGFDMQDRIFSRKIIKIWSNFVKNGQLPWSPVKEIRGGLYANYEYLLDIGPESEFNPLRINPRQWICQAWKPYIWPLHRYGKEKCPSKDSSSVHHMEKFDVYDGI